MKIQWKKYSISLTPVLSTRYDKKTKRYMKDIIPGETVEVEGCDIIVTEGQEEPFLTIVDNHHRAIFCVPSDRVVKIVTLNNIGAKDSRPKTDNIINMLNRIKTDAGKK